MLANATSCARRATAVVACEGDAFRTAALHGDLPPGLCRPVAQRNAVPPQPRCAAVPRGNLGKPIQVADLRTDASYLSGDPLPVAAADMPASALCSRCRWSGTRVVGAIGIYRQEIGRSPRSRSSWSRTSPRRPSSPSRTRGCSASCARSLGAADRDLGSAEGHQLFAGRAGAGVPGDAGERHPHLRGQIRHAVALRRRRASCRRLAWRAETAYADERRRNPVFRPAPNVACRARRQNETGGACHRPAHGAGLYRTRPGYRDDGRNCWRAHISCRADAQGREAGRRDHHLPPGGTAIQRQADRAGAELRRAGRHRHREHAAAQRIARSRWSSRPRRRRCSRSSFSSPGELQPVFDAMLENAVAHLRGAIRRHASLRRRSIPRGGDAELATGPHRISSPARQRSRRIPGTDMDILYKSKQVVHTFDMLQAPVPSPPARLAGARTQLAVPMLKDDELVGAIVIYRQEVRPFTDKQIELVTELRRAGRHRHREHAAAQRTAQSRFGAADRDLGGAQVISSSPGELEPVFQAMLENATRICEAKFGMSVPLRRRRHFRAAALHGCYRLRMPNDSRSAGRCQPTGPARL